ncbi:MAG: hypothetical protein KJ017_09405 [Alphaproteobacteria bacterium]|jgi:hypothetical protein|nr:hypothetical protein [Alphaproteobacteria bacterium]
MNIELGVLHDGGVMMVSDRPLPDIVCRVEYYRDQRLFMLVYHEPGLEEDLMHYEVPAPMTNRVEASPNIMIYSLFPNHEPIGYRVPLVQVGGLY